MSFYPSSYTVEHFHADDGNLLSGGTLEYYIAGTTTPVTVYTDSSGTEAGATITLNARGEPEVSGNTIIIWLSASVDYKVIGKNASGGIEWTIDNLTSSSAGNTNTAVAQADYIQWPYITVNGSDTNHDIDFSAGRVADSTAASMLILESAMTKQIDSAWTSGNNAGGLFSGTVANSTTYYCFLIQKDTDETIDCGFDTSSTAANIPSGYTKYRRIASLATDGSANIDSTSIVPLLSAEIAKRGEANGTCELDASGSVPVSRLPSSNGYSSDSRARLLDLEDVYIDSGSASDGCQIFSYLVFVDSSATASAEIPREAVFYTARPNDWFFINYDKYLNFKASVYIGSISGERVAFLGIGGLFTNGAAAGSVSKTNFPTMTKNAAIGFAFSGTNEAIAICSTGASPGSYTAVNTGTFVTATAKTFEFRLDPVTPSVSFYINDVLEATITTNIPSGGTNKFAHFQSAYSADLQVGAVAFDAKNV